MELSKVGTTTKHQSARTIQISTNQVTFSDGIKVKRKLKSYN